MVGEADLWADLAATRAGLINNESVEGVITLHLPTGDICVEDDLHAAIPNLCLLPIPRLFAGQQATYLYFSCAGQLYLSPVGDEVTLTGDFIDETRAPLRPLVDELLACGERFIRCLRALDMPAHHDTLARLNDHLQAARAAVGRSAQLHER